jgi:hypothetical protein
MPSTAVLPNTSVVPPELAKREPVWVFESQLGQDIGRGPAAIARKCRGAAPGIHHGMTGLNYALPTRGAQSKLLPWDEIEQYVRTFIDHAKAHPDVNFRFVPGPHTKPAEDHVRFADLLRNVPDNCELTGGTLTLLDRIHSVRIILLDANVRIIEAERERILDQYFAANAGLWNAEYIEIVSLGTAHVLVANDKYARRHKFRHRIINVDKSMYGEYAVQTRELLSVEYATKLLCLNDPTGTSTGTQIGAINLASSAAVQIDEMLIQ